MGRPYRTTNGFWKIQTPKTFTYPDPGIAWSTRDRTTTETPQPGPRAGHGSAFDSQNNVIWVFGGYRTYYPYLSTDGVGSGLNILSGTATTTTAAPPTAALPTLSLTHLLPYL